MDRHVKRQHVSVVAIGAPAISADLAHDRYLIESPAVSDDARRTRLVALEQVVDGAYLRQLVAAARAVGWTE